MNDVWTEAEKNFIRANAGTMKDADLAVALSRHCGRHVSLHAIRHARARLGLKKKAGRNTCLLTKPTPPGAAVGLRISAG